MIKKKSTKIPDYVVQADRALKSAVRKLIKRRQQTGDPMIIWRDGKVLKAPAAKSGHRAN